MQGQQGDFDALDEGDDEEADVPHLGGDNTLQYPNLYKNMATAAADANHGYVAAAMGLEFTALSEEGRQRLGDLEKILVEDYKRHSCKSSKTTTLANYFTRWNAFLVSSFFDEMKNYRAKVEDDKHRNFGAINEEGSVEYDVG